MARSRYARRQPSRSMQHKEGRPFLNFSPLRDRAVRVDPIVSRRGACDRRIWRKPLAFAADAEGYKYMVWVFNGRFAISSPKHAKMPVFLEPKCSAPSEYYHPLSSAQNAQILWGHRLVPVTKRVGRYSLPACSITSREMFSFLDASIATNSHWFMAYVARSL